MNKIKLLCQYQDPDCTKQQAFCCQEEANDSGFCYWHDQAIDKSGIDIKQRLEDYAQAGGMLRGIILTRANLQGVDLVNHNKKFGYDFSYADLYHTNLKSAHMFNINLQNASLMKADLRDSNLNCANLEGTNMLGVKWTGSKFENVNIGNKIKQEYDAKAALLAKDEQANVDYLEQAEEIYRDLRKHAEHEGIFTLSGYFIQKELTMRRLQLPRYCMKRTISKVVDIFCGYGEAPLRIIGLSIAIIFICAIIYTFTGLSYNGNIQSASSNLSTQENFSFFLSSLYYSVVTFTTLGYGDFTPVGVSRAIAAIEAFTGSFTIALFVVVFVKKMTR
ncbi:pentapeptide repeat-containing protein [Colwellia psychrerythraea]|uniref:Ion transport 2 domain protein n=1 Tax=Colwellia psychrerythraea TaxID=28229 RepID=A0A099KAG4_COLPS|nr:ion channel [Colwellia psychrerythraea]KGJ87346.1 Ion transport 2 domain protein [Colwellia psychrerythraea]